MQILTVCQPYAHLIAIGEKVIENRTWPTGYRGPLAIHTGKSRAFLDDATFVDDQEPMPFGAIECVTELVGCVRLEHLPAAYRGHDHAFGPWCWLLARTKRLTVPIPLTGRQGLWVAPPDLVTAIQRELPS